MKDLRIVGTVVANGHHYPRGFRTFRLSGQYPCAIPSIINVLVILQATTCFVNPHVDAVYELKISKTSEIVLFAVEAHQNQMPHAGYNLYLIDHTVLVIVSSL